MKPDWQNDLELTTYIREVHRHNSVIDRQARDRDEESLFLTAMQLETAARKMQERMNEMRYGKDYQPPEEQMGQ